MPIQLGPDQCLGDKTGEHSAISHMMGWGEVEFGDGWFSEIFHVHEWIFCIFVRVKHFLMVFVDLAAQVNQVAAMIPSQ